MLTVRKLLKKVRWQYVAEIALMIVLGWHVSWQYATWDKNLHLGGLESENVTASAHFLSYSLDKLGYIPYWQPFSNEGQPFVDEAYSFIVNPFNFVPVVLYGDNNGVKVSVILHFMIVGVGGWFLAQSLGMGMIARILLGALLVVKGNMLGTLGAGFFQLGVAQAYLPWVLAGALGVARRSKERWPPVLLALSFALLFFCGTIFYALPALILVLFAFIFYAVRLQFEPFRIHFDQAILGRFLFAGILTVGMVAVSALTIGLNFSLVGNHPSQLELPNVDTFTLLYQFVNPTMLSRGLFAEFSYSYVIPFWFLALIFVFIPPLRSLHLSADPKKDKRLWLVGGVGFLLFLTWGISLRPIFPWLYANIPLLAQWRFPERMLAVATFMLIFLIAFRVDGLSRALLTNFRYTGKRTGYVSRLLVGASVFLAAGIALNEVYQNFFRWGYLNPEDPAAEVCVQWMLENYPNEFIVVQRRDFQTMATFIRNGVRMSSVGADYYVGGVTPTLYSYDLTRLPSPLYMIQWDNAPPGMRENGYVPVEGSPSISLDDPEYHCVWRNPKAPGYAFSIPLSDLLAATEPLPVEKTTPVTFLARTPEHIWLEATPNPTRVTVVVAQDVAYPGWTVLVNGEPAELESVGRLLGVQLLPGTEPQRVEFIYTAPTLKLGGTITVITIVGSILFLLRAERLRHPRSLRRRIASPLQPSVAVTVPTLEPVPQMMPPPSIQQQEPVHLNGHRTTEPVEVNQSVQVEAGGTVHLVLPPSEKPYHVEVTSPPHRNGIATQVTLAGVVIVVAYLLLSQTRKK